MATETSSSQYFADALRGRLDITERYEVLGDIPNLVGLSQDSDDDIVGQIRAFLQSQQPTIQDLSSLAAPKSADANSLYQQDRIAAVDGTDAVSPLRFVSDTIYAIGLVLVTPQTHHRPRAHVTRTRASHNAQQKLGIGQESDLAEWAERLRGAREHEQSWTTTFREYGERELAHDWIKEADDRFVLLDGPVLTQNMLTQSDARELLEAITGSKRAIGYIKDLSANPLLMAIGHALNPGEVFVLNDWTNLLSERFQSGQKLISDWIEQHCDDIVRAVYKSRSKPFALECNAENLLLGLAILQHDNGGTLDHDIPMLLQIADRHVRSRFDGRRANEEVLARYSADDPATFLALSSERTLR